MFKMFRYAVGTPQRSQTFFTVFFPLFFVAANVASAGSDPDLSAYRNIRFGADLQTVAKQAGENPSQAKVLHHRPALIQELRWYPQPLGPIVQPEAAKEVLFSFYEGKLFRIIVTYDRYMTEGMTSKDLIDAISASYGTPERPTEPPKAAANHYLEQQHTVARWQDSQYRFELIRNSFGPTYELVGALRTMEVRARTAVDEAVRLDVKEAPQREAARLERESNNEKAKLEKIRLKNKSKFRP